MKINIFRLLSLLLLIFATLAVSACDDGKTKPSGLTFAISEDGTYYSVTGIGDKSVAEISIPEAYNDLPVAAIDDFAFSECTELLSINIPDGIKSIGNWAFADCGKLEDIKIPSSVIHIDDYAFARCHSLRSIEIPESVSEMGNYAFEYCTELKSVKFAENSRLTRLGRYTFNGCTQLTDIIFGEGGQLEAIECYAFSKCTRLKSIKIPTSVIKIENYTFYYCIGLTEVIFENTTGWWAKYDYLELDATLDVTSPIDNAIYLTSTYKNYNWYCGE